jgi:single-strand selective monofunctional uracil DNA glycosylase
MPTSPGADKLVRAAEQLGAAVEELKFKPSIAFVYNPLRYAWPVHEAYLRKFGRGPKRVLFLGMNPGPFGMSQTGVPFGEVTAVRKWLEINGTVGRFSCRRSEVSGQRLWGLFAARFGSANHFFRDHFVANYCPLAFLERSGRNLTPDKLRGPQIERLHAACDEHLRRVVEALDPEWLIGIGDFAQRRAQGLFAGGSLKVGKILHPSPASPAANRDWAGKATSQLQRLGVWE